MQVVEHEWLLLLEEIVKMQEYKRSRMLHHKSVEWLSLHEADTTKHMVIFL